MGMFVAQTTLDAGIKKNDLVAFVQQFKHFKVQSYVYWVTSPKKCAYLILLWASVC